ncbi:sorting nexin-8-like [Anopheles nili]|uniref:sorting nexin-8-like n=1 Tax=Anopheles nili TaxID=185578 RepID=UPI00237B70D8|nr:sorting nexin-8-like [Anopheles nili]
MPVVVETIFRQPPTASPLLLVAETSTDPTLASSSEAVSIAMMEVSEPPPGGPFDGESVGEPSITNGASTHLRHPWHGATRDASRSPSVGDTFVSAAASSDLPYPSSFSDSTDDSESGPEDEEADVANRTGTRTGPFGYITTATITLSGCSNSFANGHEPGSGISPPSSPGRQSGAPSSPMETAPETIVRTNPSPGRDTTPSSASTSGSVSIGDGSTERELIEPYISVKVVPEKKGFFLKHSKYEIKLKGVDKAVRRRYKDFVTLHRYLAEKYPYRLLPTLPPKQLMLDSLLEERRRGLQTWLTIVSLHPVLGRSSIVNTFLRDTTTDHQYRLQVAYEKQMDEMMRLRSDAVLPDVDIDALADARTRLRRVQGGIGRLRELFDRRVYHSQQQLTESTQIDHILQSADLRDAFVHDGVALDDMSAGEQLVAKQYERYVQIQQRAVTERLDVLLEVLHAHSELCERIERGVILEHQRALAKATAGTGQTKVKAPAVNQRTIPTDTITASVSELDQLARRSAFAFSCAQAETLLAERHLQSLPSVLLSYAHEEQQHHQKMWKIWHRLVVSESTRLS